ncbi:cytochrome c oxidase assembly protein [Mycobacteroides salmoniphilum]|uniref:cytochrome c oxidase assembly protein n=1 Tax=Mycobacteroides salmoniphilum TaxID=404941 RepID=UPI0009934EC4|nr:cytochrome c oxidase assembly protein [Mycobacteroides salmoniphilum]
MLAAAVGIYGLLAGPRHYADAGNPYPGNFTSTVVPVAYFISTLLCMWCVGALVYVIMMSRPAHDGLLDPGSFRTHIAAERVSMGWCAAAVVMVIAQAGYDSGMAIADLAKGAALPDAIAASETSRGWIVSALCALLLAVGLRFTVRWHGHVVLLLVALIGLVAPIVTGNPGQGPNHDYSTSTAIVLTTAVAVLVGLTSVVALTSLPISRPVMGLQVACGAVCLGYGALLLYLLAGGGILDSDFGVLGLLAGIFLAIVFVLDCRAFLSGASQARHSVLTVIEALLLCGATAAVAAMAVQSPPRFLSHAFTAWDVFLGYELTRPPGIISLVTMWRFDTFIGAAALALGFAYLVGYVRLRRRGDTWPRGRLVAWLSGCVLLAVTTGSGLRAYGSAMFSVHMAEHMILNMFIPVLLVLGGPVTLALRALPARGDANPGPREWLTWFMHSPVTKFLSNPMIAFVLFVVSPYVVYFTSLFDTLVRYHWGHELMAVHFLLVGYLFYWGIIGVDPGPRRLPHLARIGLLFAVMPFHAFFGIALMTMTSTAGGTFYSYLKLPWLSSINADQRLGGAIAWGATELPVILVIVALVSQWARQDRQLAARQDRHADSDYADDDLDAYNAMLRELSQGRR